MKKLLLAVPVVAVLVYFVLFSGTKEINPDIDWAQDEILAVNFLGGLEEYYDYSVSDRLFPENQFETIALGGSEKYLVMPRYNEPVYIYYVTFEGDTIIKTMVKKITGNFYITCNESEILSNVSLETTINDRFYSYSPFLSGKDGSLVTDFFVKELK